MIDFQLACMSWHSFGSVAICSLQLLIAYEKQKSVRQVNNDHVRDNQTGNYQH